jgi:hypothetical protein
MHTVHGTVEGAMGGLFVAPAGSARLALAAGALVMLVAASGPADAQAPRGAVLFTVDSTIDAVDALPGDGACASEAGECTLRAAVMEGNAVKDSDVFIEIEPGAYTLQIGGGGEDQAAGGDLDILVPMQLTTDIEFDPSAGRGEAPEIATINGGGIDRVFDVAAPAGTVAIVYVAIEHGAAPDGEHGGAIRARSALWLEELELRDSQAEGALGGGVYVGSGGDVAVTSSSWKATSTETRPLSAAPCMSMTAVRPTSGRAASAKTAPP